jgi:hypothetical protein
MVANTTSCRGEAVAMGSATRATGDYSTAMGSFTTASGIASTAMGDNTTASGAASTAMGDHTTASGNSSTAMGTRASTNSFRGSFVYGDSSSSGTVMNATARDQFSVRAAGGYRFFSDAATSEVNGMYLTGGRLGVGVASPNARLEVKDGNVLLSNSGSAGELRLQGTGNGYSALKSGAQGATNITYTLPTAAPTSDGQLLSSTTGGVMSWTSSAPLSGNAGGDLSGSYPNPTIATTAGNSIVAAINNGATTIDAARVSNGLTDTQVDDNLAISGGTIDNTPIGNTTRSTGKFTSLDANGGAMLSGSGSELRLQGTGSGYSALKSGAQGSANITYTLPTTAPTANGQVLGSSTGGVMSWSAPLVNFTESVNTTVPNATVPVVQLLATNAATNVDVALTPKGAGALTAQVANNAASGGNKRGANAVDWQTSRSAATQVASGTNATIVGGSGNTASGDYSTAMGNGTTASGTYSTAIGNNTVASGIASTAMGDRTIASYDDAVAMGLNSRASGPYSTAMGISTLASNGGATAMGNGTTASGAYSTAMGSSTTASGTTSTAIGDHTTASGLNSTAMVDHTTASGNNSTAMGSSTIASYDDAVAMGLNSRASSSYSTAMGISTLASNAASTAMGNSTTASGTNSTAMGNSTIASGINSTATGNSTTASGTSSTAMGDHTLASNDEAVAMGLNSRAISSYSTAMGIGTLASNAGATAIGNSTTASGAYSTAMGSSTTASGASSTAMGDNAIASGNVSTATGYHTTASGNNAAAMGSGTIASSDEAVAMGLNSRAISSYSTAMGIGTLASNAASTAMGDNTTASGTAATSMGNHTTASGINSTATGNTTTASGTSSTAMGDRTIASNDEAVAMGLNSRASGSYSTAMGIGTLASNGGATAMGNSTTASGSYSTSMGSSTTASGSVSTAMGDQTTASGINSTAMGDHTTASGNSSTAMGTRASTSSFRGSFVYGDSSSSGTVMNATANDQFSVRAAGGYRFFSDAATSEANGMYLTAGNMGVGVASPSAKLEVKDGNVLLSNSGSAGELRLQGSGSGYSALKSGAQGTTNITYTLPTTVPTSDGQVLSSTAGGVMSWASAVLPGGSAGGDLDGSYPNPSVATVGSVTAANIALGANAANAATNVNTPSMIVRRDVNGNFNAGTINANLTGNVTGNVTGSAVTFTGSLGGDVTSSGMTTTIASTAGTHIITAVNNSATTIDAPRIGNGLSDAQVADNLTISGGAIDNTPIGATTRGSGRFTSLDANGGVTLSGSGSELRLQGTGSGYSALKSGAQGTTNITYTLPTAAPASNGQVLSSTTGGAMTWVTSAAGLTNFTESLNTSAPNATVPVAQLLVNNAATNVDVTLTPKGTGALTAQVADNAGSGGNKRGPGAVDWQRSRNNATQVASGQYATIAGGRLNTASGDASTAMGFFTTAGGFGSTAMGYGTYATGDFATAMGNGASASGMSATAMGEASTAIGDYSTAMGGGSAQGSYATAMGSSVVANGSYSVAMGHFVTDGAATGNFMFGDNSTTTYLYSGGVNRFSARAAGGYWLFSDASMTTANGMFFNNGNLGIGISSPGAKVDVSGNIRASGSLAIGGGATITNVLTATATLDFGSTSANSGSDLTITVTGAALGDVVFLGAPNGSVISNTNYTAWVSASNTVTVRFNNYGGGAGADPSSGTFRVTVMKF